MVETNTAQMDEMVQSLFRSNHQLGVTARFASKISQISDIEALTVLVHTSLVEFDLDGLFQVKFDDTNIVKRFGNKITRDALDKLTCLEACNAKICQKQNYMMFCLDNFTLILDIGLLSVEQIDETKDNLATFCDIIDAWVGSHMELNKVKAATEMYKFDMLSQINELNAEVDMTSHDIKSQHLEISQNLLLMLISRFPMLGLDVDQEEEILNSIEQTIDVYGDLIEEQINCNDNLTQLLSNAADCIQSK